MGLGLGHERPAHRDLLALTAGKLPRRLISLFLEDREKVEDLRHGIAEIVRPGRQTRLRLAQQGRQRFFHRTGQRHAAIPRSA